MTNLPTPELQAAVESAHRSLSKQRSENVLIPRKHLRLILAALEERGKALERIQGVDAAKEGNSRALGFIREIALTALGETP